RLSAVFLSTSFYTSERNKGLVNFDSTRLKLYLLGLVQRCVIIQRDENGFGLTVSGDNPVFVQLVKEDGAAMRAGVQTGDRIIKVNGTLVTHSNHIEVVKLIKSGSYVALTVLGRPPGLPQIPLEEEEEEKEKEEGAEVSPPSSVSVPHSPALSGVEQRTLPLYLLFKDENKTTHSQKIDSLQKMINKQQLDLQVCEEECSRNPRPKLLKEIQEAKKHISQLQEQLSRAASQVLQKHPLHSTVSRNGEAEEGDSGREPTSPSRGDGANDRPSTNNPVLGRLETRLIDVRLLSISAFNPEHVTQDSSAQCVVGSPPYLLNPQIIGAEDDDFVSQQEQINGECSFFQSIDSLKSRPAHLAVFLHHVVSQFDPLCYLYADMHKQTSSKESRRFFMEFHSLFMDRTANLKVPVPETVAAELEKRRLELIPEELCKQYTQVLQDTLLPDLHRNLEDFRQKRSMGLTLAEDELSKLDVERGKDQQALEKECSYAVYTSMQYVILTYMKHLGVKVKEPRGLEHKRARINFLPKIKKSIKPEKEGEEKVKKPRFPNILGPPRRLSRIKINMTAVIITACKIPTLPLSPTPVIFLKASLPLSLVGSRMEVQCAVTSADIQSEDDQGGEVECEEDPLNWQSLVSRGVLASLTPQEIKRQEVINELFYTERAHLRMLKVLDGVFCQRLNRDSILPAEDIKHIFINLEEIIQLHGNQMTAIRKRSETSVIGQIGDDLLAWFSGEEEEKIKRAVGTFCSNQPSALELIKTKQKKDQRFNLFMQEAESNRLCRRLQLKDIIPVEMQRVTKYPLLLDNIAKYTEDGEEREKVKKAGECCKKILNHVNQAVKEAENKQRLEEYQRRLDLSSLKQSENPMILELKNLDLTKRKMVHEGPLCWKVNKDKTIELYTILLEDILVLLQKQDERLILKFHGKNLASAVDTKHIFSPIIKLNTVLVRPVATDNKSFFVLSMSENGAQIYELMAQTVSDQRTWQRLITQRAEAMKAKPHNSDTPPAQSE
uniref:Rho guanine nucleotide exchange factor (GEF) 12b n=1 Tax=Lates calcarifer TaxID=8187 RepID=A0A4W6D5T5_LATCA